MADTVTVRGAILCVRCAQDQIAVRRDLSEGDIVQEPDPTICARCGLDNGQAPLGRVLNLPMCVDCTRLLRNYPFPRWVKAAALLLVGLVIFALAWNIRFTLAYLALKRLPAAMEEGDFHRAAELMRSAADHVPEASELGVLADFHEGVVFLQEDRSAEALERFRKCSHLPPDFPVRELTWQAEMGVAFDAKDYDTFLSKAREFQKAHPQKEMSAAMVASALACKYAETGDETFQRECLALLDQAQKWPSDDADTDYRQRILHRLRTREIIDRKEFQRRFPNGWSESAGKEQRP
jgi:tetratricopeptide (TPR) repeat protein